MPRLAAVLICGGLGIGFCGAAVTAQEPGAPAAKAPRSRTFLFTYATVVEGLPAGKTAHVWLPMPPSNEDQEAKIAHKCMPGQDHLGRETKYGNQVLYFEAPADENGKVSAEVAYRVKRNEVKAEFLRGQPRPDKRTYLEPDSRVPIDGKPLDLIQGKEIPMDQMAAARLLYDLVNNHMRYEKKGTGWGRGDSIWACEHGYGNCTDFHSLFISLARSQKIPAKFEIGFPLPEKRGAGEIPGYHCWAKFRPADKDWIPVDISEANKNPTMRDYYFGNLTENRVAFSMGRDLELVPPQNGEPLNFFVYPYVEVDGKPYAKLANKFTFKDLHD